MKDYTDSRDAVFQELYDIAIRDSRVIVLSGDTGAMMFEKFQKNIPDQFYNLGLAEQNMMSVAAGLAKAGKRPFVYAISNFTTLRCLEQIRNDVCGMNLPVTILGSGTGFTYASDGMTHHMTEDVAIMRALPDMTIFSPSDYNSCALMVRHVYEHMETPVYLRFDKGPFQKKYSMQDQLLS